MKTNPNDPEMGREAPYFDKHGNEIREFDLIKVFHFKGVNDRGNGRKNYYMYKWVKIVESHGKMYWAGFHLNKDNGSYWLKACANTDRKLTGVEIVQSSYQDRYISK
jgi:hypothetical protein